MDLIVFDLDGTLLNASAQISPYTRKTLSLLAEKGILFTVATGRTLHSSRDVLADHPFTLPQAYKNGVVIWNPEQALYSHHNYLTLSEIEHVLEAVISQGLTPFMFTVSPGNIHGVYHPPLQTDVEHQLAADFRERDRVGVYPAAEMPFDAKITNISALGNPLAVDAIEAMIADEPGLLAFAGIAIEGAQFKWIDIHHIDASKGNAVNVLKQELGISRVLCFGDSDNDLSMFAVADEAYAPSNAKEVVKQAATAVLGHHDEDSVARFLRQRFGLAED
ncbi:MAG: Cof-type HAD-IIB family hydrolase [Pseudomonadaceae bacterium]|nr:Cof-type HAD-IIB family hydrolase [Pseudomonadaceae bacterium]